VFGHTDFFKHNVWFSPTNRQMVETVSQNAQRIRQYGQEEGSLEIEHFLDAVLSISDHIDPYPRREAGDKKPHKAPTEDHFGDLFPATGAATSLATGRPLKGEARPPASRKRVPADPEKDLLRFLLEHGEHLEDWQRDIIAIVREESLFYATPGNA
jgi:stage V sporulation protein R